MEVNSHLSPSLPFFTPLPPFSSLPPSLPLSLSVGSFLLTPGIMICFPSTGIIEYRRGEGEGGQQLCGTVVKSPAPLRLHCVCARVSANAFISRCANVRYFPLHFHKLHTLKDYPWTRTHTQKHKFNLD